MANPGILIAEDNTAMRDILRLALQDFDLTIHVAADGADAIEIFRKKPIDLVLLDVRMPRLDGPNTLAVLKTVNPDVVCCFMSGHTENYSRDDLLALGAAEVLDKPFRLEQLYETMDRLLPGSVPAGQVAGNRRMFPRLRPKEDVNASCTPVPMRHERNLAKAILNISESGVALLLETALDVGQEVSIRLDAPHVAMPIERLGTIAWSVPTTAKAHGVGIHLKKRMALTDVRQLA